MNIYHRFYFPLRHGSVAPPLLIAIAILMGAGCAHYEVNEELAPADFEAQKGYRLKNVAFEGKSDDLLVILAFSGGGTRAASLSYGVLEELSHTTFVHQGKERRLLDEIDIISSVSGGSFTAAYFGLFGDQIFEDFEEKFLKRNIQGKLTRMLLNPIRWPKLWSPYYNRDDMAAELYHRDIFEGKTFEDLLHCRQAPFLMINATDISAGSRFEFTQSKFDLINSDLSSLSVSRAVAASSAVPGLFGTVRFINHAHKDQGTPPLWIREALDDLQTPLRLRREAMQALTYGDATRREFIHLVDGGVTDNLGLRAPLDMMIQQKLGPERALLEIRHSTEKVLLIAIDAHVEKDLGFNKTQTPGLFKLLGASVSIPMNRYSFETMELFNTTMESRLADAVKERRASGDPEAVMPQYYPILLQFNELPRREDSDFFKTMPTSFKLEPEDVDRLRSLAAQELRESKNFKNFLNDFEEAPQSSDPL